MPDRVDDPCFGCGNPLGGQTVRVDVLEPPARAGSYPIRKLRFHPRCALQVAAQITGAINRTDLLDGPTPVNI